MVREKIAKTHYWEFLTKTHYWEFLKVDVHNNKLWQIHTHKNNLSDRSLDFLKDLSNTKLSNYT